MSVVVTSSAIMGTLQEQKIILLDEQQLFLAQLESKGRSLNTLKNYKTDLDCFNNFLTQHQTSLKIDSFTGKELSGYHDYLQVKYRSDNSRRRRVQTLRLFFDFLVKRSLFNHNPVRDFPPSPKFLDIPRPTPFSEIKTLWSYQVQNSDSKEELASLLMMRNQLITLLIFGAGLKVSDLFQLKSKHIIVEGRECRVMIAHAKGGPYTVPLPPVFKKIFSRYSKLLEQLKSRAIIEFDQLLFNANPHKILSAGITPRGVELVFADLRKKLLLTVNPKSLRQACIFKWITQQRKDAQIKEWLGVAPSYSLKPYKESAATHHYTDSFLEEI
ncbi:MAG: site-specific integrase [Bdellovibrionales bacterium]|nr:site-specific integrase [Bdellovibrionales bacterium]MBT3525828.1 site-specific integrase [Bdellovibrionales bacterium]MBT7668311.1 site-specific integrase [Bdellovibrionales bacterium]MBT7767926.1 site-specific integrase [Bdellovibrionales bacterium]